MHEKVIYIIPGFKHKPTQLPYQQLADLLAGDGYLPVLVSISWNKTTISQNVEDFVKEYKKVSAKKKYIIGFSFGAMIAFIASTKVSVSGLILCSLSPYFKEDLLKTKKIPSSLSKQKYHDFSTLHAQTLAKQTKAKKICMLYGKKESRSLIKRVIQTFDYLSSPWKYLIAIKETEHDISDKRYLSQIYQSAKHLH